MDTTTPTDEHNAVNFPWGAHVIVNGRPGIVVADRPALRVRFDRTSPDAPVDEASVAPYLVRDFTPGLTSAWTAVNMDLAHVMPAGDRTDDDRAATVATFSDHGVTYAVVLGPTAT